MRLNGQQSATISDANLAQAFTSQCHVTEGHPDWYVDSGATGHMTSSPDNVSHSAPHSAHKLAPRSIPCVFISYNPQYKGYKCLESVSSRIYIIRHARFDEVTFPSASTANALSTLQLCTFIEDGLHISNHSVADSWPTDTRPTSSSPCGLCPVPTAAPAAEPIHELDSPSSSDDDNPQTKTDDVTSRDAHSTTAPTEPSFAHQMKTCSKSGIFKTKLLRECVSLLSTLFNHNACVAAVVAAMNSDSHDDSATVSCFCVLQLIAMASNNQIVSILATGAKTSSKSMPCSGVGGVIGPHKSLYTKSKVMWLLAPLSKYYRLSIFVSLYRTSSSCSETFCSSTSFTCLSSFESSNIAISKEFVIKDLGDMSYFFGLEVSYTEDGLFRSQAKYATNVLIRAEFLDSKPVSTPLAANEMFLSAVDPRTRVSALTAGLAEPIIWDIGDEEEEYPIVNKCPSFKEEPIILVEEESCPVYDTDNEEEESMPVYDTDIEDVIGEEEGFVGK
uniref:Zinc finger, CCHC-type n=1 Tax=Tanacetum cinerariifolium TaxID=118510 RepID=A0A6L2ML51_TANCI|nr:zinc finger, CCHC-type [Tanacetum cinerariifolium]